GSTAFFPNEEGEFHEVTVVDTATGCTATQFVDLNRFQPIVANFTSTNITCLNGTSTVTATISGGCPTTSFSATVDGQAGVFHSFGPVLVFSVSSAGLHEVTF